MLKISAHNIEKLWIRNRFGSRIVHSFSHFGLSIVMLSVKSSNSRCAQSRIFDLVSKYECQRVITSCRFNNTTTPEAYRNGILFRRILSTTYTNLDHPLDEIYKSRSSGVGDRNGWGGIEIVMWGGVKWGWGVRHMGVALLLRACNLHKGSEDIFANTTLRTRLYVV